MRKCARCPEVTSSMLTFLSVRFRMMWAAGAVAAMSSITFPAVSALVSRSADPDQQGEHTHQLLFRLT